MVSNLLLGLARARLIGEHLAFELGWITGFGLWHGDRFLLGCSAPSVHKTGVTSGSEVAVGCGFNALSSTGSITAEAANIIVSSSAANRFSDWPSMTACQPTVARHANTKVNNAVVTTAAGTTHRAPRTPSTPQKIESAPNIPPLINAVFAFSGFDR